MSKSNSLLVRLGAAAGALISVAVVAFWLLDAAFVSAEEFTPVVAQVAAVEHDLRELRKGVALSNCLQLAERKREPWAECVEKYGVPR